MAKNKAFKTNYLSKEILVTTGKIDVVLTITPETISMAPSRKTREYIFKNRNKKEIIKRWNDVLDAMRNAVSILEEQHELYESEK